MRLTVDIWLGYAIWCGHLSAEMGCFVASLAVVGAWGDQLPSGVVRGGPRVTQRCHRRPGAYVSPWLWRRSRFFPGGLFFRQVARSIRRGVPVLGLQELEI